MARCMRTLNLHRNIRHHITGERVPTQPVSHDEESQVNETSMKRSFIDGGTYDGETTTALKSTHTNTRPLTNMSWPSVTMFPARLTIHPTQPAARLSLSHVDLVASHWQGCSIANSLPNSVDGDVYRQILTQVANHVLLMALAEEDTCLYIDSHRDALNNIDVSHAQWHDKELRC